MEYTTTIKEVEYLISSSDRIKFLVESKKGGFYILVRNRNHWDCADQISFGLLQALGAAIDRWELNQTYGSLQMAS